MATVKVGTGVAYLELWVDYNTSLEGNYPDIKMVYSYRAYFHFSAYGSINYDGAYFNFHSNSHKFNIHFSTSTSGNSSTIASGTLKLPFGSGVSCTHNPGFSTSFGNVKASGNCNSTITLSKPSVAITEAENIGPYGCTFGYHFDNVRNYWRVFTRVSENPQATQELTEAQGDVEITNLSPETEYTVEFSTVDRSGSEVSSISRKFTTLVDQLKIMINQNGTLKVARVYLQEAEGIKKVKKGFVMQSNELKKITNVGNKS